MNAAEIRLALAKLNVVGRVLYVAAHPDDENTAFLAWGEKGRLLDAGYLAMTRGDGGQNLIGSETAELLGVVRTEELLAARRVDGAKQFFTRTIDFGYSKSPAETLTIWDREKALADVVRVFRTFRPDVVVNRFPTTGEGGHGQHTASALLSVEAFEAAGDPARFPEQIAEGLAPWKPRRVYFNVFRFRSDQPRTEMPGAVAVDLGAYNALLGRSYTEIAAQSRSMHKSQGFGSAERRGSWVNDFQLVRGDKADKDLFEGIDLSWKRVPGGGTVAPLLREAERTFRDDDPAASLPVLLQGVRRDEGASGEPVEGRKAGGSRRGDPRLRRPLDRGRGRDSLRDAGERREGRPHDAQPLVLPDGAGRRRRDVRDGPRLGRRASRQRAAQGDRDREDSAPTRRRRSRSGWRNRPRRGSSASRTRS